MNWKVRAYHNDTLLEEWIIENRTEKEAEKEANSDLAKIPNCNDWSLMELCPFCKTELEHIDIKGEDVFGCPKCKKEVARSGEIEQ